MTTTNVQDGQEIDVAPVEGGKGVPAGFWLLFGGLIAFGAYYLWAYTPWLSGWTQDAELIRGAAQLGDGGGVNVAATILFTAVAVLTAGGIVLGISRRKGS